MKAKSDIIYDTLSSNDFTMWYCDVFVPHSIESKGKRKKSEAAMKDAITRHFRQLFVQTAEEQDAAKPTPEAKPAPETKPKATKEKPKRKEARVNVVITGAPEPKAEKGTSATPKEVTPEAKAPEVKAEVSALDSAN